MRALAVLLLASPALVLGAAPLAAPAAKPRAVHAAVHQGSIDLPTGLYVRVNEDLVVAGSPRLVLRRTYLSGFRESREFGIGATHSGEEYLIGDGEQFQWVSLILARGTRITFKRVTPGTTVLGARFVHDDTAGEWQGAEVSWRLLSWVIKKRDGGVLTFRSCGQSSICSIVQSTDGAGQTIDYKRDVAGRLLRMESASRWIAFEYDGKGRIQRAHDSSKRSVRYAYDDRGRLERVTGSDGTVRKYSYSDLDELETIDEPGASITNAYEDGRCVRQVNWYPDRDPYLFELKYQAEGRSVHRTRISESNGTWREYAWDDRKSTMSELHGRPNAEPAFVMYERDAASRAVVALTVSCKDRDSRAVRQRFEVQHGEAELLKLAMLDKLCS